MSKKTLSYRLRTAVLAPVLLVAVFMSTLTLAPRPAHAFTLCCAPCWGFDCVLGVFMIIVSHLAGYEVITGWFEEEMEEHQEWLLETFFSEELGRGMALFTTQMSAVALQQVMIIGTFLDAKHQLETQRLFQKLKAQAHKDYQPSEDFCWFGTNTRSLNATEALGKFNSIALGQRLMARHLGNVNQSGSLTEDQDLAGRWEQFVTDYCDPRDNNWQDDDSGLELACGDGALASDRNRVNRDIDFTRLVEEPRTLNVNFSDNALTPEGEEEDIMALAANLYGHKLLSRELNGPLLANVQAQQAYLWLRSVAAKRSVAENSFSAIVGLKSAGTLIPGLPDEQQTRAYLGAILAELGIADEDGDGTNEDEIFELIGEQPSYYAQLEILTKKIYQNPDFYANLYDKPANVERKSTALKAIDLMLDRAMYESQLRREMVLSVLLSSRLRKYFRDVNQEMVTIINQ